MRRAFVLLLFGLAVLVLAGCGGDGPARTGGTVARVVDGDTIRLVDGTRVRLVQIDAPERAERECYAARASRALERLVPAGTQVELERDRALDDRDRFGRALRYVVRDDTNVNVELVRAGAAAPYFFRGDRGRYADDLLEAADEARNAGRGLWAACPASHLDPGRALATGGAPARRVPGGQVFPRNSLLRARNGRRDPPCFGALDFVTVCYKAGFARASLRRRDLPE